MFSVIIPLYNKEKYISKCITSVINQTFTDFEIIVINDGSTDNSLIKLLEFSDNRLIILKLINNMGVSVARNKGSEIASHPYLVFLDADDWWDIHFLEEMKNLIEGFSDAGLYGCSYYYHKNGKNRIINKGLHKRFKYGYIDYFKVFGKSFAVLINCSFAIVPKTIFNIIGGFNTKLIYGEDFDLWVRIALKYKVAYLNIPLAYSNQDVEKSNRAIGNSNNVKPINHYIFNLEYLNKEEKSHSEIKHLIDGLRVRSLIFYHLNNNYSSQVNKELQKVEFKYQQIYYRFIYGSPKWIVKLYFNFRTYGSKIKQYLIRILILMSKVAY